MATTAEQRLSTLERLMEAEEDPLCIAESEAIDAIIALNETGRRLDVELDVTRPAHLTQSHFAIQVTVMGHKKPVLMSVTEYGQIVIKFSTEAMTLLRRVNDKIIELGLKTG